MIWIVFKRINEKSKLEIPEFVFPVQFTIENGSGLYKVNKWRGGEGSWWQVGYHVQWPLKPERTTVLSGKGLKFRSSYRELVIPFS